MARGWAMGAAAAGGMGLLAGVPLTLAQGVGPVVAHLTAEAENENGDKGAGCGDDRACRQERSSRRVGDSRSSSRVIMQSPVTAGDRNTTPVRLARP